MRVLLDTHTLLWFLAGDEHLSESAKRLIVSGANEKYISVASLWEIFIKISINKLKIEVAPSLLLEHLQRNGFIILAVEFEHLLQLLNLDFHHKDPFDRLIIAQAQIEKMDIITKDENFGKYPGMQVLW